MLNYIVVQAGGRGSRMASLTRNKPKALVPVNNLPIIFYLFRKFPDKKFVIIGDYKYDVLKNYLREFANIEYQLVCASGHSGTCAGLREAMGYIPKNERFMLIWCDLILPNDYEIMESERNVIGISKDFPCRWMYKDGQFREERSTKYGVAGHFIFRDKSYFEEIPSDGEFVKWLKEKEYTFVEQPLYHTHEYGIFDEWNKLPKMKCRPFNRICIKDDKFIKEPIDNQGKELAIREINWYKKVQNIQFKNIPKIYNYNPLSMEKIQGENIYQYTNITVDRKKQILAQIIDCLKQIHSIGSIPSDKESYYEAYIGKTFDRLKKVRFLVPFANDEYIVINGIKCWNVFYVKDILEKEVMRYFPDEFRMIHGDCTFSNIILRNDAEPVLIDPRGYFGKTEIFGDEAYDWVKLYYSLFSNYDQFNLKRFDLYINNDNVEISVESNGWEELENEFFVLLEGKVTKHQMMLLLALVWLSLTTYAWEDYDSICGSFYIGISYLNMILEDCEGKTNEKIF